VTTRRTRLNRAGWLQLGLEALATDGPEALTVEALCQRARRTRGSFYHHFTSTEDFLEQMVAQWRKTHTDNLIAESSAEANPAAQLDQLNTLATRLDPNIEQGIRRLAAKNVTARHVLEDVDNARIAYLAELYTRSGRFDAEDALSLAKIEYAAFVGMQVIFPDDSPEQRLALYQDFLKLTERS